MKLREEAQVMDNIIDLLELRIFAYDVLRRVFWEEPTKELVEQLKNVMKAFPFRGESSQISEGLGLVEKYLNGYKQGKDFDRLHWDYTRMFIGPYKLPAPIWESSYVNEEKLLFQEETLQVRMAYLKYDFLPKQDGREAEDHLGLELDFMYQLSKLSKDLVNGEEMGRVHDILLDQYSFLQDHLIKWTPLFRDKVVQYSETDFYKGMVKILNGFLIIDVSSTDELLIVTKQERIH